MANGTIAFDTLQTSGQITGTAKSVDTDFVVNGSAKVYHSGSADGATLNGSLNVSTLTDTATGKQDIALTSSTSDNNYSINTGVGNKEDGDARYTMVRSATTSGFQALVYSDFTDAFIDGALCSSILGDLA
jgi:hypothetical protein